MHVDRAPVRRCGAFVLPGLSALLLLPPLAAAQEDDLPTPEEYAEAAAAAEAAPLFQSDELIKMTLLTDIEWLRDERNDSVEIPATLTFMDADGSELETELQVRTRGNFRRNKRNCNFPPLRLNFRTGQMDGTVFEGQDRLKLVTPCHDGRDDYQRYIYDEYLAYKVLEALTPRSFRTRLVEITYVDIEDDYDSRTKIGFLIEDEDRMAERNLARLIEAGQFHPSRTEGNHSVLVAVFNYMIANLDWSPVYFHNVKLIRAEDGTYLTVPYDFDFSGLVNARYAVVPEQVADRVRRVTQRLYRGFCRDELQRESVADLFNSKRQEIEDLYRNFELLDEDDREKRLEFYEDFYEVVNDPDDWERRIVRDCREWLS